MRRTFALLSILALAACGGGDDPLTKAEATDIVEAAQLTADDLGEGWEKTADDPPEENDEGEGDQLEECLGEGGNIDDDTLAESNDRTFERSTSEIGTQQVVSSTAVVEDEAAIEEFFDVVDDEAFATCFAAAFEEELAAGSDEDGYTTTFDAPEIALDEVDGADHSARITAPFAIELEGLTIDGRLDFILAAKGQVLSFLGATSIDEPIPQKKLTALTELLVSRA